MQTFEDKSMLRSVSNSIDLLTKSHRFNLVKTSLFASLLLLLTACGGGGGGGTEDANSSTGNNTTASAPTAPTMPPANTPMPAPPAPMPVAPPAPAPVPMPVADQQLFATTVYPILKANTCNICHNPGPPLEIVPFIAHDDVEEAYNQVVGSQRVDLNNPANSRLVVRPRDENHNCGGAALCAQLADEIEAAITVWAAAAAQNNNPPNAQRLTSMSTSFANAIDADANRADENLIAMYDFSAGAGDVVRDRGGVGDPMDLLIEGEMEWIPGGGLRNISGKAQASLADSMKLFNMLNAGNQFSVEAWVIPENTNQTGPARIVSYSRDTGRRNFTLGQRADEWSARVATNKTGANGSSPELNTNNDALTTELTHVVMTYDNQAGGRKIYLNGVLAVEENLGADNLTWQNDNFFVLGNEVTNNRLWRGDFKFVAIHASALNDIQVAQNFEAGLGGVTTLAFDVSNIIGSPSVIQMQAREFDDNSYLFAEPVLLSETTGVPIRNIRIAVNDSVPVSTQAFRSVDMTVSQNGQMISPLGAIIPQSQGPEMDTFHLEFEMLAGQTGSGDSYVPPLDIGIVEFGDLPEYGVRSFASVNDTMSVLTTVSANRTVIRNRYADLRDQLPSTTDLLAFNAAQQIAIQRLAATYCGEVVNINSACNTVFGSCNIANSAAKLERANALFDRFVGDLDVQPERTAVTTEVVNLMNDLGCANGCDGAQEDIALQASCAAVLSSGIMTIN
jgi:hypothetical protein